MVLSVLERGNSVNHSHDFISESQERWNNRLRRDLSLVKQYLSGRLTVAVILDFSLDFCQAEPAIEKHTPRNGEEFSSLYLCFHSANTSGLYVRDQEPVLISDVETMKGPEGVIPSFVCLYDGRDMVSDVRAGLAYRGQRGYEFFPRFANRELDVFGLPIRDRESYLSHKVVESGSQVVNGISGNQGNGGGNGCALSYDAALSALGIVLREDAAEVNLKDCGLQVRDVLFGPFNL
jgi:hypothetical protein